MFSVAIPIYNHAKFLRQAIWSALRSPLVEEVLLLDDGSRDGSAAIAASMAAEHPGRLRDLTPSSGGNRGAHHCLNELAAQARCDWVAVLNSDDAFVSGRFETMIADSAFVDCDLAFGNVLFMDERGALMGAKRGPLDMWAPSIPSVSLLRMVADGRFSQLLREKNYLITTSNMVFRKSLHARIGGFHSYRYVHDWDFALRAMAQGRTAYIRRFLTAYRIHPRNTIQENEWEALLETRRMLKHFEEFSSAQMGLPSVLQRRVPNP